MLRSLTDAGLQDDSRFAEAYVRYRRDRGYGPRRIAEELRQRGIDDALKERALAVADDDWLDCAVQVYSKKFRDAPGNYAERTKQMRFLQYRGFDNAQINYALEHSFDDENS